MPDEKVILTVSQLNEYIKGKIESDRFLSSLFLKGELSNFVRHKTGHLYFTIKDETSLIRGLMFSSSAGRLKFTPENGMKVILHGRVSAYLRDGVYNFYADSMEPDGIGALYVAYEQLKKKLEGQGLFDVSRKKPLPKIPTRIGVITSPTGAAIRDIINIISRRFPYATIFLYPSLVQGEGAPEQLIEGLRFFNEHNAADVIIIGRGGGSMEDLWAFNHELLARTVAASRIPVISAVGHETDFTICDFVADRRAPTPSAAAEIAVPETGELERKIFNIIGRMQTLLASSLAVKRKALNALSTAKVMRDPVYILDEKRTRLIFDIERFENAAKVLITTKRSYWEKNASKLEALNPMAVLLRGYAAVFTQEKKLVKSVDDLSPGDSITLTLKDGQVRADVRETQNISAMIRAEK